MSEHNIYLGEKLVPGEDSPFDGYSAQDWAMYFIEHYGQIDGDHHKQWVIDQVARTTHEFIEGAGWLRDWFVWAIERQYNESRG